MDDPVSILTLVSSILGLLLAISELLAWSACEANAITQIPFCYDSDSEQE